MGADTDPAPGAGLVGNPSAEVVAWSLALANVGEHVWLTLFRTGTVLVFAAGLVSVLLLPLRGSVHGTMLMVVLAAVALVSAASLVAFRRAERWVHVLRREMAAQLGLALVAAGFVSAVFPLRSQLWYLSAAILVLLALTLPLARSLAWCLLVLLVNLAAHLVAGDLKEIPAVTLLGLWVGLPFWTLLLGAVSDLLVGHVMDYWVACTKRPAVAPLRVRSWVERPPREDPGRRAGSRPAAHDVLLLTNLLTARQRQIITLLIAGLSNEEIAAELSVRPKSVSRAIGAATMRTGIEQKERLVATVAGEWWALAGTVADAVGYLPSAPARLVQGDRVG